MRMLGGRGGRRQHGRQRAPAMRTSSRSGVRFGAVAQVVGQILGVGQAAADQQPVAASALQGTDRDPGTVILTGPLDPAPAAIFFHACAGSIAASASARSSATLTASWSSMAAPAESLEPQACSAVQPHAAPRRARHQFGVHVRETEPVDETADKCVVEPADQLR